MDRQPERLIKAVLFDLDGVLVDACDWHKIAFNEALKEIEGIELTEDEHVVRFNGLPTREKLSLLVKDNRIHLHNIYKIEELKQVKTKEAIDKYCIPQKNVTDVLAWLKENGILTACVTNSISNSAFQMLRNANIIDLLDLVVTNQDITRPKPCSEPYVYAMVKLKVFPSECIIVEDSPKGKTAAINTGAALMEVTSSKDLNIRMFEHLK